MLLDTSGLLCFFDEDDFRHRDAVILFSSAERLITHNYVLAEFIPLCHSRRLNRREALNFISDLLQNTSVEVVWINETLHLAAHALLHHRTDKTYSLCDAVSFLLMRERNMNEALTTDHHFEQEGLTRLLPS
jgi:predicted nucleic acid-binding protein